ncbi:IPTL-CTERM sorting domain-containing protein [Usitatibacter palustris]|uniref:Bacterial Ig-like domain-containing protein n=1 Tax=Usitatibacter palustris TaxID=2732487 RepID=A0A6M4HCE2_9PROT|nr:IPTL-CTERM sorting domain-containing protein [Usitatibacter palustris]QJR16735.1 hypothetical protein DSM104440_03571 [Usitatibacter palustris]
MYPHFATRTAMRWLLPVLALASIALLPGFANAQPFAYVTENTGGSIARINLADGTVVRAAICSSPRGVAINKAGTRGYVACGGGGGVREFDAATLATTNSFATCGGDTSDVVIDPVQPRIFVTCGTSFGTLHAIPIDGSTPMVAALTGGSTSPRGLSIDLTGTRLVVADTVNGVYALDLTLGFLNPVLVRPGNAHAVAFDAVTGNTYQAVYGVTGVVETITWPSTVSATATNLAGLGPAYVVAGPTGAMAVATVNIGSVTHCGVTCSGSYVTASPINGLAYTRDSARLIVSRTSGGEVVALNGSSDAVLATYTGFSGPWGVATGPVPVAVTINQAGAQPDPTTVASIVFTVVFSEAVTGFDAADILFTGSTVGGTLVANVTGAGPTYTVTVTGMTGDGNVVASVRAFAATSVATGIASFTSTSTDNTVVFGTPPSVTINQAGAQADPATAAPINFTVTFSEAVTGFATGDVTIGGTALPTTATVTGGPTVYNVAVTGMTVAGTVTASIAGGVAVDLGGNANAASTSTDNTVTYAPPPLTVTINQAAGQSDPANQAPVRFTIVFSTPVTGFDPGDISFTGSTVGGTLSRLLTGSGANYTLIVAGMTSSGNIVASIPAGVATNGAITNSASTSTDNTVAYTYVTPGPPFAYVTNLTGNNISVVSMTGLVTVATIPAGCPGLPGSFGPTGIVLNAAGTRAYFTCGDAGQVNVLDLTTSTIVASIPIGGSGSGIAMNAAGTRVYASSNTTNTVAVIDTATNTVITSVPVGTVYRLTVALSDSANRLYVPNTLGSVTVIDLATNAVAATVPAVGTSPAAVSMNPAGTRAYVSAQLSDEIVMIDTATNTVVGTIPLGTGALPFDAIVSPSGATLYTANHGVDGIGVIDTATNTLTTTIPLNNLANPRGMAMTPSGNQLWVVDQQLNGVSLIDPATNTVIARVPVGSQPVYVALGPPVSPTVTINQAVGQVDPALTVPINFTVTFSEPVTGFAASDVAFTGSTAAGTLAAVVTGGPTTYNVAVSGMTSAGTVVASIPAGGANGASGTNLASTSTDNSVTFAPAAPTVTINQAVAQVDPTAAGPINFTVTFSEPVTGFATGDVTIGGTALPTTATITGGPTTYTVAVTGMTSAGTVIASVAAGVATGTAFGSPNVASTSTDNSVTFAPNAPTVTINQAVGQADPVLSGPINFTAVFNAAVTSFDAADIQFTGSTAGGTLSAVVTGGPTTFNVAVSGMASAGTVVASIPAGAATLLGVGNIASTSADNSVTYAPSTTTFSGPTATGTGTQTIAFTGGGAACTFGVRQLIGAPPGAAPIPPTAPGGVTFPHGLFDFTTTGCTAGSTLAFTLTYPTALPGGTTYWKYGPTASNTAPHWYTLPATVVGNTITFSITDGGLGDDDLVANGTIVDQGGPGIPGAPGTVTAVPTLSEWMLMLLATLMLATTVILRSAAESRTS